MQAMSSPVFVDEISFPAASIVCKMRPPFVVVAHVIVPVHSCSPVIRHRGHCPLVVLPRFFRIHTIHKSDNEPNEISFACDRPSTSKQLRIAFARPMRRHIKIIWLLLLLLAYGHTHTHFIGRYKWWTEITECALAPNSMRLRDSINLRISTLVVRRRRNTCRIELVAVTTFA